MKLKTNFYLYFIISFVLFMSCSTKSAESSEAETTLVEVSNVAAVDTIERLDYEIVFCLDATGSMSGLITTAKEKIWDIVSGIAQSQEVNSIKLGMIFYRDKGDVFVTRSYPLTENIDSIYSELLKIQAQGGGDAPESVNQALHEAVSDMTWSVEDHAYRTIFLVGDCPPHMDYNETKYEASCSLANETHIIINTIKLGMGCPDAIPHFQKIASLTQGLYKQIGQEAEDYVISTPFDDSINYFNFQIDDSKIYYGSRSEKDIMYLKKGKSIEFYNDASVTSNSARAKFNASKSGKKNRYGKNELVQDIIENKIVLDSIAIGSLPDEFKDLSPEEQKVKVAEIKEERLKNEAKLDALLKKQDEYIRSEKATSSEKKSFSDDVINTMKKQAEKSK
jgi:Mg-chelatase subunit ChlD